MSILIFLIVLFVLVLVHEFGHFIVAKKTGMRVDEFAIGFPPRIFGKKKGETLYAFNALPIGGYVKIFGEDGITDEREGNDPRSFTSRPKWAQALVLVAGVAMNVLLAWLLFVAVFLVGVQSVVPEEEASDAAKLTITSVLPESPAAEAGIPIGAEVRSVTAGGETKSDISPSAFTTFTQEHHGEEITITYRSSGEEYTSTIIGEKGLVPDDSERVILGVSLAFIETVPKPPIEAVVEATTLTATSLRDITVGITSLIVDAVQFDADFSDVAGPVGIVNLVGEASAFGVTSLLMFTAFISLNLAIINLLPFPALDGGRLLFVIIEAVKGSRINPAVAGTLNMIGFVLLMLLMVAVTVSDIVKLV